MTMKRFWISWYEDAEDYRPLTDPPNAAILGWWCTGFRGSDDAATLCACVSAIDERSAKLAIVQDWPGHKEWRFCDETEREWTPNNRLPIDSDWMKERLKP